MEGRKQPIRFFLLQVGVFLDSELAKHFNCFSVAASLTATLEYVEEKTNVDSVFVNFQNDRNDRGGDLLFFLALRAEAAG